MRFVLIDESTSATATVDRGGVLSQDQLVQMAAAWQIQLDRDVSTWWGGNYQGRVGTAGDIQPGEIATIVVDALPNAPDAVAYHDVGGDAVPVIYIAREQCSSVLTGTNSIACAGSHECVETAIDEYCNAWRDDFQGSEWAQEGCDCTQEDSYEIDGVTVSNFALPSFFAAGSKAPWTFNGANGAETVPGPFGTAPGGYQMKRQSGGGETQVNGSIKESRLAKKRHPSSRTARRGAHV